MTWNWEVLCGKNESTFSVWNAKDFGFCFEQLIIVCIPHVIFAICSAYHFSKHDSRRLVGDIPHSVTLHVRMLCSVLLVLSPIVLIALVYLYEEIHPSMIDIITWSIRAISWLIHSGFLQKLKRLYHIHLRGPTVLVLSFLLTTVSTIIQLRTTILHHKAGTTYLTLAEEIVTYIWTALHFIYALTLIPWRRPQLTQDASHSQNRVNTDETQGLLDASLRTNYNSIEATEQGDLGVALAGSNIISKLFFWWVQPLMVRGSNGLIDRAEDLFQLPVGLNTKSLDEKIRKNLEYSIRPDSRDQRQNAHLDDDPQTVGDETEIAYAGIQSNTCRKSYISLMRALNRAFGCEFYSLGILKFLGDTLGFAGPILLNYLVTYMENANEPIWHGYVYASLLFASTLCSSMLATHFDYFINITGMKIRAAIITSVYRKSLSVSSVSLNKFSTGEVVNFMSTDSDRIVNFCPSFHQFWSLPVQVAISLYLLYSQVGLAFLAGLGFAIILIPINKCIADKIGSLSKDMMVQKDGRVKIMNEILYGIRVIKFYVWEPHFTKRVGELRSAEVKSLKWRKYLDALCVYFWATTPVLISILTFMTYALLGNQLTAAKVFTSMALFNMLIQPLNAFPWVLNGLVEAWVSIKRLESFFELPELHLNKYYDNSPNDSLNHAIDIVDAHFTWRSNQDPRPGTSNGDSSSIGPDGVDEQLITADINTPKTMDLSKIHFKVPKGSLVGVIGKVGSGKSSLLSAITAEMRKESGEISVACLDTGFGLVAQEPWIQHATIKDNIIHGKSYQYEKYTAVIEACALTEDLKILPAGDETEIGENGVTLSGGQKARVALARAVYQNKDLYLFDDPLAAVDAHVAKHLFNECIRTLLEGKTRIICTHHTKYLKDADLIVLMEDGKIKMVGSPIEVLSAADMEEVQEHRPKSDSKNSENSDDYDENPNLTSDGTLVTEEEKDKGVVKGHVYTAYWRAVGSCLAPLVLVSLLLMQASRNFSDWWLSYWVTHSHNTFDNSSHGHLIVGPLFSKLVTRAPDNGLSPWRNITESDDNIQFYLMVYGIIAGCNTVFTFARAFLFAYGGVCAATTIHDKLLASVLKTPISFFDMTPIGRVINRFSTDVYSVDDSLPFMLNIVLAQVFGLLGSLVITCYGLPFFAILLLPLGIIYFFVQKYYRQTSRELKRISSVTLSPVYAHFSETVSGLATIRALRETERFREENQDRLELNQRALFCSKAASKWLGIRLQMIGVVLVTGVAFIAVLEHHFRTVNPGLVGLAISYALSVTNLLNGVVVFFTETEMQMVSVERASQYTNDVPQEKNWSILNAPPFWPIQGTISFQKVCLQYRAGLPLALHQVTFESQQAEKIGIVGRTGSGKSSLFLTLFRMHEIQSGQIFIDGINISHLPLNELRSRLAIIPQDPFLFSGSVRDNLDPTNSYTDTELWTVLERCHLKQVVCSMGGLETDVGERGRLFSVGQRQLLCLGRALLTRAKVLCIDEATASVDQETDNVLQETIRHEFRDNTVLTIAHRINTILDSDRVLVMHGGSVAEFDKPDSLLANQSSLFYSLVNGR